MEPTGGMRLVNSRIRVAELLLRIGEAIKSLPVAVLRPRDMSEWARGRYDRNHESWRAEHGSGHELADEERELWTRVRSLVPSSDSPRIMVLGGGGGREAVVFGVEGWDVTVLDTSSQMLLEAQAAAAENNIEVKTVQGDLGDYTPEDGAYDVVWTSMYLYSVVMGRARRVAMLRRIGRGLALGGLLVVSFHYDPRAQASRRNDRLRRFVARVTFGNKSYQNGDLLFGTLEFRHAFAGEDEVRAEISEAGFSIVHMVVPEGRNRGAVILEKSEEYPSAVSLPQ